jgi:hypothetical protein
VLSADHRAQLAVDLGGFQHDPLGYVLWAFPWGQPGELEHEKGPRDWQREVLREVGELAAKGKETGEAIQEAVSSGHGIGKSALVAWLTRWAIATHEDARGVITANTDTQLRNKTWPELSKWHRLAMDRELFVLTATSLYSAEKAHEKTWRLDAVPWSENNTPQPGQAHHRRVRRGLRHLRQGVGRDAGRPHRRGHRNPLARLRQPHRGDGPLPGVLPQESPPLAHPAD